MLSCRLPNEIPALSCLYDLPPLVHCEPLKEASGFSGARLWRLRTATGELLCLRRWPLGSDASRIEWIHEVLRHVGPVCGVLAVPLRTKTGRSVIEHEGCHWELASWLAGEADFHQQPTDARLESAVKTLASFHSGGQSMPGRDRQGIPPAIIARLKRIDQLQAGLADEIKSRSRKPHPALNDHVAKLIIEAYEQRREPVREALLQMSVTVRLIPCLRDVWHDHLLFVGDCVSGIVDYDAIRTDTAATDLSRLLGSLLGGDYRRWTLAMQAYEAERALSPVERRLVFVLDEANVALTGMQWLEWLVVRKIAFENMAMVRQRLNIAVNRLPGAGFWSEDVS